MSCRRNLQQKRQPPQKHEQSTSFAVREAGDGAAVVGAPSPQSLCADASISELRRKIDDVCREVKVMKDNLSDLEDIRSTVSALQDTVKSDMKKMREESAAVNKRIMMKIEKIQNYLMGGESDTGKERPRSSKFVWQVNDFTKLKDQMLKGKAKYFYSENFYVGTHGYKMYLGGTLAEKNKKGKASLSIYAYITRGPYDRTLQWPYKRLSTFVIVDQKTNQHHKMAEMVPQEIGRKLEHCFQRPRSGPNEGIGFTGMIALEDLEDPEKGYLVKDSFLVHFITCEM